MTGTGIKAALAFGLALAALGLGACGPPDGVPPGPADRSVRGSPAGTASPDGAEAPAKPVSGSSASPTGIRYLSGGGDGFALATAPRPFEFPEDHGAHPEYRSEWWYFTGNVRGEDERHFGFELTFFRYALAPEAPQSASAWSTNQFWMAHLAVTDTRNDRLIAEERLTRGALGLAGAEGRPFRAWVEDWSATATDGRTERLVIDAHGEHIGLDLVLEPLKPPVVHGDRGLDAKGPEFGNASYYYSLPRLAVGGTVVVDGDAAAVEGHAWMDREWSTSALSGDVEGWDWFALQLSDGRDLMVYRLRRRDGTASPFSGGSLIDAGGGRTALGVDDLELEPLDTWQSPRSGARYPIAWRLRLPRQDLDLEVRPYVADQEIDLSVRYWEGAVRVEGTERGRPIAGNGYVELAGY